MRDRSGSTSQAVLVGLDFGETGYAESLAEAKQLATSAGVDALTVVKGRRQRPDPALFAGKGKVEEIAEAVASTQSPLTIFNHELSIKTMGGRG